MKNYIKLMLLLLITTFCVSGCSVKMATSIKSHSKVGILTLGQNRDQVIAQLGQPDTTVNEDKRTIDTFTYNRNSAGLGYLRGFVYGVLDVGTLGLMELIATPLENFIQNENIVTVEYDKDKNITRVDAIQ